MAEPNNRVKSLTYLRAWSSAIMGCMRQGMHSRNDIAAACDVLVARRMLPRCTMTTKNEVAQTIDRLRARGRIRRINDKYEVLG